LTQRAETKPRVLPILIHGDAALSGQGVVYEVAQMAQLEGYRTGGTVHIVVNNQVGFTTNYLDGRSSIYCTDVSKVTESLSFHVNADDAEAVVQVMRIALAYRQRWKRDVYVDLLGYRKYGHNEGDEPMFTQPQLYKAISGHPNPLKIYIDRLISDGSMEADQVEAIRTEQLGLMERCLRKSAKERSIAGRGLFGRLVERLQGGRCKSARCCAQNECCSKETAGARNSHVDVARRQKNLPKSSATHA